MSDDLDVLGYETVRQKFQRGDYNDAKEVAAVKKWLRNEEKIQKLREECEAASISAALDAKRSGSRANILALCALLLSLVSSWEEIYKFVVWLIGLSLS